MTVGAVAVGAAAMVAGAVAGWPVAPAAAGLPGEAGVEPLDGLTTIGGVAF
jgi:hypothetical protein